MRTRTQWYTDRHRIGAQRAPLTTCTPLAHTTPGHRRRETPRTRDETDSNWTCSDPRHSFGPSLPTFRAATKKGQLGSTSWIPQTSRTIHTIQRTQPTLKIGWGFKNTKRVRWNVSLHTQTQYSERDRKSSRVVCNRKGLPSLVREKSATPKGRSSAEHAAYCKSRLKLTQS
jgi:hypothetical protein